MPLLFQRVAVIGLGLIGGSVAGAARASEMVGHVSGFAPGGHGEQAHDLGLIDEVCQSIGGAVDHADLVVVATPVTRMPEVFAQIAENLKPGAIVTDCGSTKSSIIDAARRHLGDAFSRFVPGHPISGSEFSGPTAASADLFHDKLWLLAPVEPEQLQAAHQVKKLVESFGATCQQIDANLHDDLFAEYSHAPHALVFAICQAVADGPNAARLRELAGAGFKDTTRIGASSPALWTGILLDNRAPVVDALDRYLRAMTTMRELLDQGKEEELLALLSKASTWRASLD